MIPELDKLLCEKYPKIFVDRHKSIQQSCMAWGFEIGDGWFNIIDTLCANIQNHIDWQRRQRASALRFNRALERALKGDKNGLVNFFSIKGSLPHYANKIVEDSISEKNFRSVPDKVNQVVAEQVKEKFGTLRFYYRGGDPSIHGMVAMAESMSGRMCEYCGAPAKPRNQGWLVTMCQPCEEVNEQKRRQELADYNARHQDVYDKLKEQK